MHKGFQENPRLLFAALFVLSALVGTVHAGLIPAETDVIFSTRSYGAFVKNGLHLMSPDHAYSSSGRVYVTNDQLLKEFQPKRWFMSMGHGLDALTLFNDPTTGKLTTWFSTGRTFDSRSYGRKIGEGDLLSRDGSIVATNQDLLASFAPNTTKDMGLDAVSVVNPGAGQEIWFSTRKSFYSNALGQEIGAGDLLSNDGRLIATNADLLAAFAPRNPNINYGLDAVHVLSAAPGEDPVVLFSTEKAFYSTALKRTITPDDILSNTGELVLTKKDLMKNFGWHIGGAGLDVIAFAPTTDAAAARTNISRSITPPTGKENPTVPDPATLALLALGGGVGLAARRHKM